MTSGRSERTTLRVGVTLFALSVPIRDAGPDVIEPLDATERPDDADMANDADVVDAAIGEGPP